jgi:hypothetical protein
VDFLIACRSFEFGPQKCWLIDRAGDWYEETVVDLATGETIHECSEPLSEHWEHGSARGKDQSIDDVQVEPAARGPTAGAREPSPPAPPWGGALIE